MIDVIIVGADNHLQSHLLQNDLPSLVGYLVVNLERDDFCSVGTHHPMMPCLYLSHPTQMAVDLLKRGIEGFAADQRKLETLIAGLDDR